MSGERRALTKPKATKNSPLNNFSLHHTHAHRVVFTSVVYRGDASVSRAAAGRRPGGMCTRTVLRAEARGMENFQQLELLNLSFGYLSSREALLK